MPFRLSAATALPVALFSLCAPLAAPALADQAYCHYSYGGEARMLAANDREAPYAAPTHAVGSYFRLRPVLETDVAELAALKVYVYADHDSGPALIHQGSWPWPPEREGRYGFTGLQRVYEPLRDGEIAYWCSQRDDAAGWE